MGFLKPDKPKKAPEPPTLADPSVDAAAQAARQRQAKMRGRAGTIFGGADSGLGGDSSNVFKRTLGG